MVWWGDGGTVPAAAPAPIPNSYPPRHFQVLYAQA
jgi:hypothetical protein